MLKENLDICCQYLGIHEDSPSSCNLSLSSALPQQAGQCSYAPVDRDYLHMRQRQVHNDHLHIDKMIDEGLQLQEDIYTLRKVDDVPYLCIHSDKRR
jgi:hypothetical protein